MSGAKAKRGRGRPKGAPNKRTRERQAEFAKSGKTDPLESQLELHEWALREFKRATQALAAFEKKHAAALAAARIIPSSVHSVEQIVLIEEHGRLTEQVDKFSSKIHAYAMGATPFLHARLASTEANVKMTNHEAALEELDED